MSDIENIRKLLLSVLVVALSPFLRSAEEDEFSPESQKYFFHAKNVIKGSHFDSDTIDNLNVESIDDNDGNCPSNCNSWVDILYKEAEEIAKKDISGASSAYMNVALAEKLKVLFTYLSLWTAVMISPFEEKNVIATSAAVESEFSILKNREIPDYKYKRADKINLSYKKDQDQL